MHMHCGSAPGFRDGRGYFREGRKSVSSSMLVVAPAAELMNKCGAITWQLDARSAATDPNSQKKQKKNKQTNKHAVDQAHPAGGAEHSGAAVCADSFIVVTGWFRLSGG